MPYKELFTNMEEKIKEVRGELRKSQVEQREGNGNPLQYSCLENFTDRRTW